MRYACVLLFHLPVFSAIHNYSLPFPHLSLFHYLIHQLSTPTLFRQLPPDEALLHSYPYYLDNQEK